MPYLKDVFLKCREAEAKLEKSTKHLEDSRAMLSSVGVAIMEDLSIDKLELLNLPKKTKLGPRAEKAFREYKKFVGLQRR